MTNEMREHNHVIQVIEPRGSKLGEGIPGIQKLVYQLRVTNAMVGSRRIIYRNRTCWCRRCVISDYDNCVTDSKWIEIDLKEVQRRRRVRAAVPRYNGEIDDLNEGIEQREDGVENEGIEQNDDAVEANNEKRDAENDVDEVGDEDEVVDSDECDTDDEGKEKQNENLNKRRRIGANTEMKCRCGCKRMYEHRELSECRGKECHRLIRAVCPSTFKCARCILK